MGIEMFTGDNGELCAALDDEFAAALIYDVHAPHKEPLTSEDQYGHQDLTCTSSTKKAHIFVKSIEVEEEFRRQGVATALVGSLIAKFPEHTLVWSFPQSPSGRAFIRTLKSPGELCRVL